MLKWFKPPLILLLIILFQGNTSVVVLIVFLCVFFSCFGDIFLCFHIFG